MTESLEETERKITTEERMQMQAMESAEEEKHTFNPMPKSVGSILKVRYIHILIILTK